jgi:2-polyprenyl-3-methyl-5-hydroxy-6-metoxy-1,4-benzoquinol methylase
MPKAKKPQKQEAVFDANYFKTNYKNYALQNPRYKTKAVLKTIKKYKKTGSLLDVGCAYCSFISVAEEQGYDVQGCDLEQDVLDFSKERFLLQQCPITALKYNKEEFDIVTVLDVIEHVKDYADGFMELKRVMNKNGIAVFVMPVYDGLVGKIVMKLDKDTTHINKFSRFKWLEILAQEFDVLEWQGVFRYLFFSRIYANIPTKLLRKYSPAIMVVCKKK